MVEVRTAVASFAQISSLVAGCCHKHRSEGVSRVSSRLDCCSPVLGRCHLTSPRSHNWSHHQGAAQDTYCDVREGRWCAGPLWRRPRQPWSEPIGEGHRERAMFQVLVLGVDRIGMSVTSAT